MSLLKNITPEQLKVVMAEKQNEELIVAIDCGKGYVKICFEVTKEDGKKKIEKIFIESRVTFGESETSETVYINGAPHAFKDGERVVEAEEKTKFSLEHKVLMRYALYEVLKRTGISKYKVVFGCSLDTYRNKIKVGLLREFMLDMIDIDGNRLKEDPKTNINMKVGKFDVNFEILDLVVQPETLTSIFSSNVKFAEENAFLIDIGTLNSQIIPIELGRPLIQETRVDDLGYDNIIKAITQTFNDLDTKSGWYNFGTVKSYIEGGKKDELFDEGIKEYFVKYCTRLKKTLKELKCNKFSKIIFTGGSSNRFEGYIRANFIDNVNYLEDNVSFVKEPFYANVVGMYIKGSKML